MPRLDHRLKTVTYLPIGGGGRYDPQYLIILSFFNFKAPVFVIGLIGVIVGPVVYGFILAAFRTMVQFRKAAFEAESAVSSSAPGPMLP